MTNRPLWYAASALVGALSCALAPAAAHAWTPVDGFRVASFSGSGTLVRDLTDQEERIHLVTKFSWRAVPSHEDGGRAADIAFPRGSTPLFRTGRFPWDDDGIRLRGHRSVTADGAVIDPRTHSSSPFHCAGGETFAHADGGELNELSAGRHGARVAVTLPVAVTEKPLIQAPCSPPVAGGRHVLPVIPDAATAYDSALDDDMAATARISRARLRHGRIRLSLRAATTPAPGCGPQETCSQTLTWKGRLTLEPACPSGAAVRKASGHLVLECDSPIR